MPYRDGQSNRCRTWTRLYFHPNFHCDVERAQNTMAKFLIGFLSIWGALHLYVFWRLASIPWIAAYLSPLALIIIGIALWSSYVVARILDEKDLHSVSWPIEYFAANWIGLLFLMFWALLAVDVFTLGGWLFHDQAPTIRGWGVAIACVLSIVALIQAIRPPVVTDYEVQLDGLPRERDGTLLLQLSDLHLGNLLGRRWLGSLISRVNRMKPDIVVIAGDLVDGNVGRVEPLRQVLKELHAPLGVWAVTGNHEFYAGLQRSVHLLEDAGFRVLRDRHEQAAPGLVLAGVDDLTARTQFGAENHAIDRAMANRPQGATILLSHSPWQAEKAAAAGTGLMLSGHTHNGQVWPFNYFVQMRYPLLAGRYQVNGMTAIVCRGTGTWGPRMRLWRPSEMVRVKLRAPATSAN
jgi:predicted MPP superfamily phosphohydrolase